MRNSVSDLYGIHWKRGVSLAYFAMFSTNLKGDIHACALPKVVHVTESLTLLGSCQPNSGQFVRSGFDIVRRIVDYCSQFWYGGVWNIFTSAYAS